MKATDARATLEHPRRYLSFEFDSGRSPARIRRTFDCRTYSLLPCDDEYMDAFLTHLGQGPPGEWPTAHAHGQPPNTSAIPKRVSARGKEPDDCGHRQESCEWNRLRFSRPLPAPSTLASGCAGTTEGHGVHTPDAVLGMWRTAVLRRSDRHGAPT